MTHDNTRHTPGLLSAAIEMFAARDELDLAPTHNSAVFDKAMSRHDAALASLRAAILKATGGGK